MPKRKKYDGSEAIVERHATGWITLSDIVDGEFLKCKYAEMDYSESEARQDFQEKVTDWLNGDKSIFDY